MLNRTTEGKLYISMKTKIQVFAHILTLKSPSPDRNSSMLKKIWAIDLMWNAGGGGNFSFWSPKELMIESVIHFRELSILLTFLTNIYITYQQCLPTKYGHTSIYTQSILYVFKNTFTVLTLILCELYTVCTAYSQTFYLIRLPSE